MCWTIASIKIITFDKYLRDLIRINIQLLWHLSRYIFDLPLTNKKEYLIYGLMILLGANSSKQFWVLFMFILHPYQDLKTKAKRWWFLIKVAFIAWAMHSVVNFNFTHWSLQTRFMHILGHYDLVQTGTWWQYEKRTTL